MGSRTSRPVITPQKPGISEDTGFLNTMAGQECPADFEALVGAETPELVANEA